MQGAGNPSASNGKIKQNVDSQDRVTKAIEYFSLNFSNRFTNFLLTLPEYIKTKSLKYTFWNFLPSILFVKWKILSGYKKDPKRNDHYMRQWPGETTSREATFETRSRKFLLSDSYESSLLLAPEPGNGSLRTAKQKRKTQDD